MKHWRSGLTLALAGISVVPVVHEAISATYTASPTAVVPTPCDSGPGDLQSCLNLAAEDPAADTILLQPGNYTGGLYIYNPGADADEDDDGGALLIQNETATLPIISGEEIHGCLLIDNTIQPSDFGADITVDGLVFQDCIEDDGGGLQIYTNQARITLSNSNFFDNASTDDDGGAAFLESASGPIDVQNSVFEGNDSDSDGGALGIVSESGNISLLGNQFTENTARDDGGAAQISGGDGNILIEGNLFSANSTSNDGGGIYLYNNVDGPGNITIVNNIFAGNINGTGEESSETYGGALFVDEIGNQLTITNNTIFGNTSQASDSTSFGGGVAIFLSDGITADVFNNIIFGNSAQTNGGDIYSNEIGAIDAGVETGGTLNLFNNDFTSFFSEALDNGAPGTVNQGNNIDDDPLFVNSEGGNFNLTANSPAIDKGDPSAPSMPATDFAGNPRPAVEGTNPDMGALEFQPEPSPIPTPTPVPPVPPVLLQGASCSLQTGALPTGTWLTGAWLLVLGAVSLRRKIR